MLQGGYGVICSTSCFLSSSAERGIAESDQDIDTKEIMEATRLCIIARLLPECHPTPPTKISFLSLVRLSHCTKTNGRSFSLSGRLVHQFVHLTNNAVQRRSPAYGKEEPGNKLTLEDLQVWLDGNE